jgi:hypothetical protein
MVLDAPVARFVSRGISENALCSICSAISSQNLGDVELVTILIETIDQDDLYSAVLDNQDSRHERLGRGRPT